MPTSRLLETRSTTMTLLTAAQEALAKRMPEIFEELCDQKELLFCACLKPFMM